MTWWQYAALGAAGGALVEVLAVFKWITYWQADRRNKDGTLKEKRPSWRKYIDVPLHSVLFVIRVLLGAGTSALFGTNGEIKGAFVAVGCGVAAPAILAQLGAIPQLASLVRGGQPSPDNPAPEAVTAAIQAE